MKNNQVTIKDIAKLAGVSFATVSRCLNDSPLVAARTKARVTEIAAEQGFEFNSNARSLITSRAGTVGVILPEDYTNVNVNLYHGMLINNLRTSLETADVDLLVTYQRSHASGLNNVIRLVNRRKVDGLLLVVEHIERETLHFLDSCQFPYVCLHYPPNEMTQHSDVIYSDNYAGGRMVAEHLILTGRRSLLIVGIAGEHPEFALREEGFCRAAAERGARVHQLACTWDYQNVRRLLESERDMILGEVDGIFALNDLMAVSTIKVLTGMGLRVPEDVAVVGYDDSIYSEFYSPTLSSVHQPKEELARQACERLLLRIDGSGDEGRDRIRTSLPPYLIGRESSGS